MPRFATRVGLITLTLLSIIIGAFGQSSISVGAFNVQVFGTTKASKPDVMAVLTNIVRRYDVILIQEIRDLSGTAIVSLLNQVNAAATDDSQIYSLTISPRLGRTSSKEQYAFLYLKTKMQLVDAFTHNDIGDVFEREPYIATFNASGTVFQLAALHAAPSDADKEIGALASVYQTIVGRNPNTIFLGDFNAGCTYWPASKRSANPLRQAQFSWVINDNQDTTTGTTLCPYDRIVVAGDELKTKVDTASSGVFDFGAAYSLPSTLITSVSDHKPVYTTLVLQGPIAQGLQVRSDDFIVGKISPEVSSTDNNSDTPLATILGGALGAAAILGLVGVAVIVAMKRRKTAALRSNLFSLSSVATSTAPLHVTNDVAATDLEEVAI
eukprot:Colp12_sorted_trinity150504_noHs@28961